VVWFYTRGEHKRSIETRLALDGKGYELVITDEQDSHVESFQRLPDLLAREHELLAAWRAAGWRQAGI
jgi:hypothetical protein